MNDDAERLATAIVTELTRRGQTLAAAESLTGGLVCGMITAVPGASAVLTGGIVAYTPRLKTLLAGVPAELIDTAGVVSRQVAEALAVGAARRCEADWGVGTTGAAGPHSHGGQAPGTVWLAVAGPNGPVVARGHRFDGDRESVRHDSVMETLMLLSELIDVGAK